MTTPLPLTKGRLLALSLGVPLALALIAWTGLTEVAYAGLGSYPVHLSVRVHGSTVTLSAGDADVQVTEAAGNQLRLNGKAEVSRYFSNYDKVADWHLVPGLVEGRPAILVFDPNHPGAGPKYFMLVDWQAGKVAAIRDFRHAAYVVDGLEYRI